MSTSGKSTNMISDDLVKSEVGVSSNSRGSGSSSSSTSIDSEKITEWFAFGKHYAHQEADMFTFNQQQFYKKLHVQGTEFESGKKLIAYLLTKLGKQENKVPTGTIFGVKQVGRSRSPVYKCVYPTFRFTLGLNLSPELLEKVPELDIDGKQTEEERMVVYNLREEATGLIGYMALAYLLNNLKDEQKYDLVESELAEFVISYEDVDAVLSDKEYEFNYRPLNVPFNSPEFIALLDEHVKKAIDLTPARTKARQEAAQRQVERLKEIISKPVKEDMDDMKTLLCVSWIKQTIFFLSLLYTRYLFSKRKGLNKPFRSAAPPPPRNPHPRHPRHPRGISSIYFLVVDPSRCSCAMISKS
jgi:hypothetical protein